MYTSYVYVYRLMTVLQETKSVQRTKRKARKKLCDTHRISLDHFTEQFYNINRGIPFTQRILGGHTHTHWGDPSPFRGVASLAPARRLYLSIRRRRSCAKMLCTARVFFARGRFSRLRRDNFRATPFVNATLSTCDRVNRSTGPCFTHDSTAI